MTGPLAPIAIAGTAQVKGLVGEEQSVDAFYARLQDDIASGKDPVSNVARIEGYDWWLNVCTNVGRINGRLETHQNFIVFDHLLGGTVRAGHGRLLNPGGRWTVEFQGFSTPGIHPGMANHYWAVFTGHEGYSGYLATAMMLPAARGIWQLKGLLFPTAVMPDTPDLPGRVPDPDEDCPDADWRCSPPPGIEPGRA